MGSSTSLKLDQFNRPILTDDDAIELLLMGKDIESCVFEESENVLLYASKKALLTGEDTQINKEKYQFVTEDVFHTIKTGEWLVPDKYQNMDIEDYILSLCETKQETDRVIEELKLYHEYGLYNVLKVMVYLVDHMREQHLVWGVGRGSSVSSYCLFLIGVHKIDSLKYDLNIREFLK